MGFFDFLKKKEAPLPTAQQSPTMPTAPAAPSAPPMPAAFTANSAPMPVSDTPLELPELPSFESSMPEQHAESLPALPTLDTMPSSPAQISAPAQAAVSSAPTVKTAKHYGDEPLFCDVETYQIILANISQIKEEVGQMHTYSENMHHLQHKAHLSYDAFHSTLHAMTKKMMMAEQKLFSK